MSALEDEVIDREILEQTNPVFNTAKMTVFQLAGTGNRDAQALCGLLGLTHDQTQNSATTTASPEQELCGEIIMELRYRTVGEIALQSGSDVVVDLPCGYTPRALEFARCGCPYVGLDLPAAINECEPAIRSLMGEEESELVRFAGVDATNYASLHAALEGIEGSLCITTEGLMMYFTESELTAFCENVRRLLVEHGGCWVTADPEIALAHMAALKVICGERLMEVLASAHKAVKEKSDFAVGANSLVVSARNPDGGIAGAFAFLKKLGLKAERMVVADHMPKLETLGKLDEAQREAFSAAMRHVAFWKITPDEGAEVLDTSDVRSKDFDASAEIAGGELRLALIGRLDTISSPYLLSFFEKNAGQVERVRVDCSDLDYVSSAGLRVLLLMQKRTEGGVTLSGVNAMVREVIDQTGLSDIIAIEE